MADVKGIRGDTAGIELETDGETGRSMNAPSEVEKRLADAGLSLPGPSPRGGSYVQTRRVGDVIYTAGQLPFLDGELGWAGRLGDMITIETARAAVRQATLNCLGAIATEAGSLDCVTKIIQLRGFVQSASTFHEQHLVVDAASELLLLLFGPDVGAHVRTAIGASTLPLDAVVELELVVAIETEDLK